MIHNKTHLWKLILIFFYLSKGSINTKKNRALSVFTVSMEMSQLKLIVESTLLSVLSLVKRGQTYCTFKHINMK